MIQVAKLSGFSPIIATASPHSTDLVKSLGATHVVDRNLAPDALRAAILEITGGEQPKVVYDAISLENTQSFAAQLVAPGGNLIIVLSSLIPEELASGRQVTYVFGNVHTPANRKTGAIMYSKVTELFENGTLRVSTSFCALLNPWRLRCWVLFSRTEWKSSQVVWRASRLAYRG